MKKKIARFISQLFILFYKLRYGSRVQFGRGVIVNHRFKLSGSGTLKIEDGVNLWAHEEPNTFHLYSKEATIQIGKKTRLNGITCHSYSTIQIGERCLIGSAILMDTDFHTFSDSKHVLHGNPISKSIQIGSGVWLAGQCVLLKGVQIGDRSVVGFRAVVTKSFPANVVVVGNPGRVVKEKG